MNKLEKIISQLENKSILEEINKSNMELFRKEIVPIIYNEQKNFPRDKKNNENWSRLRKFEAPSRFMIGVWTGATYSALLGNNVPNRNIIIETSYNKNMITIADSEYLNATLYLNNDTKELLLKNAKKILLEKLK